MSLINTKCPHCGLDYPTSDQIAYFRWYCSDECAEAAKQKKREDITIPDHVQEVDPEDTEEVYDSQLFGNHHG